MKKLSAITVTLIAVLFICLTALSSRPLRVSAATTGIVNVSVASGCVSYVDGQTGNTYLDVPFGSDVNLSVNNNDNWIVQNITGGSVSASVNYNSKSTNNNTPVTLSGVYRPVTLTFTPVPKASDGITPTSCPVGSSVTTSSITINPATASLACSLSGNQWDLSGSFSGNSLGTGIYTGSTLVATISPANINQSVAASSTAQTFYVIDGTNYFGKGTSLVSATCPAYVASVSPSSPSSSSASKTTSTTSGSTASTNTATSTATSGSSSSAVKLETLKVGTTSVKTSSPVQIQQGQPLVLSGKTVPFGVVTLTIHSTPQTVTTNADKDGNWSYTVTGLDSGDHTVQAAVKDPATGQTSPAAQILAFSIKPVIAKATVKKSNIKWVVAISAVVILLAAGCGWYFWQRKKKTALKNLPPVETEPLPPNQLTPNL